jgi:hypothetical protein
MNCYWSRCFSNFFGFPQLIIIPQLHHTHLSLLHEVCDSHDQAVYHTFGLTLGALSLTWHVAGLRVKVVYMGVRKQRLICYYKLPNHSDVMVCTSQMLLFSGTGSVSVLHFGTLKIVTCAHFAYPHSSTCLTNYIELFVKTRTPGPCCINVDFPRVSHFHHFPNMPAATNK